MKKYALILISILLLVVFSSGCTNSGNATKTYNASNVSFNYPSNWEEVNPGSSYGIVGFGDPASTNSTTNMTNTVVVIQKVPLPSGMSLKKAYDNFFSQFKAQNPSFQIVSENKTTTNGTDSYDIVYKIDANGTLKQEKTVWIEKNGNIYLITASSLVNDFYKQLGNFNTIINSFRAQ